MSDAGEQTNLSVPPPGPADRAFLKDALAPGGHAVLVYVTCPSTTHLFTPSNPAT